MGSPTAESPRVPTRGTSASGQPGLRRGRRSRRRWTTGRHSRATGQPLLPTRVAQRQGPRRDGVAASKPAAGPGLNPRLMARGDGDLPPRGGGDGSGPVAPRKAAREGDRCPYRRPTQVGGCVAHRGERVIPPQGTRQTAPVTSGEGGPTGVHPTCAGKRGWGAERGPRRLFTKNTGPCQVGRRRIGADTCPVPEG